MSAARMLVRIVLFMWLGCLDSTLAGSCMKGMSAIPAISPYPHPLIYLNQDGITGFMLCDSQTDRGGWYVIQRRTNGDTDFYRNWQDYKQGFGYLSTDFWVGLDNIYKLTSNGDYELRIDLEYNGTSAFAQYSTFKVANEGDNYRLTVAGYSPFSNAGDALTYHNDMEFTTMDRENDLSDDYNCAVEYIGGWWYNDCHWVNLNGKWGEGAYKGPRWRFLSVGEPVTFSEMKIRRKTSSNVFLG